MTEAVGELVRCWAAWERWPADPRCAAGMERACAALAALLGIAATELRVRLVHARVARSLTEGDLGSGDFASFVADVVRDGDRRPVAA